ncbi:gliding motility lipoprotein GldD [Neotamlana laminarinivorans]|uniref:Gliding motility lipoprotein GldD n=1 Tax=Neotamlana laminarinivorans TaxID=2883124 RepID=A0A9X1HZS8_9FLAO|nr:gliding motility lipoprotein GldD [Tamlana laminarinivorans]MCB4797973.1 gliding motility lipoprotein GldD [Tamlana laminarinivorans]
MIKYTYIILLVICFSCNEDYKPKPKAQLRLDFPETNYVTTNLDLPFTFDKNLIAEKIKIKPLKSTTKSYGLNLEYPALKGTIFITYKAIENNQQNLKDYLKDAQKFTLEHTQKADEIPAYPYEDSSRKVYGLLSEVKGDVASPAQFYVTDSINHFITGSVYFYAKPNYDSIYPAAQYLQNDVKRLMESLQWK